MIFLEPVPFPLIHQGKHISHPLRRPGDVHIILVRQGDLQQILPNLVFVVLVAQLFQRNLQILIRQITQPVLVQCHYCLRISVRCIQIAVIYRTPRTTEEVRRKSPPFVLNRFR